MTLIEIFFVAFVVFIVVMRIIEMFVKEFAPKNNIVIEVTGSGGLTRKKVLSKRPAKPKSQTLSKKKSKKAQ